MGFRLFPATSIDMMDVLAMKCRHNAVELHCIVSQQKSVPKHALGFTICSCTCSPQPLSRSFILFNFQEHNEVSTIFLNYPCSIRLLYPSESCLSTVPPKSCTKPIASAHTPTLSIPRVSHQSPRTPNPSKCTTNQFPDSAPRPVYSEAAPGTHGPSKVHTSEADKATAASKEDHTPEPEKASQTWASNMMKYYRYLPRN